MKCFNCIDTVYMENMGDGDWKCPVCGDEYNQFTDYDLYADPILDNPLHDQPNPKRVSWEYDYGLDAGYMGDDDDYDDFPDDGDE